MSGRRRPLQTDSWPDGTLGQLGVFHYRSIRRQLMSPRK